MRHYDSSTDRIFNCAVLYITANNHRKQANLKTIAPAADLAMELAVKIVRADKRRKVQTIVYTGAIEQ